MMLEKNNKVKNVKQGWSWTVAIFGPFVPLFRKDLRGFANLFFVDVIAGILSYGLLAIAFDIGVAKFYNDDYIKRLRKDDWTPKAK